MSCFFYAVFKILLFVTNTTQKQIKITKFSTKQSYVIEYHYFKLL